MKENDYVTFKVSGSKPPRVLCVRVDRVQRHATFRDLLRIHGLGAVLPGVDNLEEGVATYYAMANRQGVSYRTLECAHGSSSAVISYLNTAGAGSPTA